MVFLLESVMIETVSSRCCHLTGVFGIILIWFTVSGRWNKENGESTWLLLKIRTNTEHRVLHFVAVNQVFETNMVHVLLNFNMVVVVVVVVVVMVVAVTIIVVA